MTYCVDYDFEDGWVFEEYTVISVNYGWATVRLTRIEVWQRCACEDRPNCIHTVISMGNGEHHPAIVGRSGVGSTFKARAIGEGLTQEEDGHHYAYIRIHTAKNISCVGKRMVDTTAC